MKQPFINVEDKIDRLAGRRLGIPKGVYRFKTHEEANEWMDKMLARNADRKTDQTANFPVGQPPKV